MAAPRPLIVINDSTLRDGEQAPGVAFNTLEKVAIALALEAAGVDEIEAGIPAMGGDEITCLREIARRLSRARAVAWCRMREDDIDQASATGLNDVHVSVPASDRQIIAKRVGGRHGVLASIARVVRYARACGFRVSVGAEDASRADPGFLGSMLQVAEQAGASKFRFADTLGVLDPFRTLAIFQHLRSQTRLALEFHGHDDLGLATANTLAAVRGGASHVSVCVLGLGERAGNAALEEVVAGLSAIEGRHCAVDLASVSQLAQLVSKAACRAIPEGKPIVGGSAFMHEAGLHVSGLVRDPTSYEALEPARFGRRREIVLGKHSGRTAVRLALARLGVAADDEHLVRLLARVRAHATERKRVVIDEELLQLHAQTCVAPPLPAAAKPD